MIAGTDIGHSITELLNDAGTVRADDPRWRDVDVREPAEHEEIESVERRRLYPDADVTCRRRSGIRQIRSIL